MSGVARSGITGHNFTLEQRDNNCILGILRLLRVALFSRVTARSLQNNIVRYVPKFEHNTPIGVAMNPFGTELCTFSRKGAFFPKNAKHRFFQRLATSGRYNSAMIIDRQKFIAE